MGYFCRTLPFEIIQKFWLVLAAFSRAFFGGKKGLINGWKNITQKWKSERRSLGWLES
jgi:hypothetical protein